MAANVAYIHHGEKPHMGAIFWITECLFTIRLFLGVRLIHDRIQHLHFRVKHTEDSTHLVLLANPDFLSDSPDFQSNNFKVQLHILNVL